MARNERVLLTCCVLLPLVALSNESLWIDEANAALKAIQPSLASWWHVLVNEKGSDLQMPFYMLYLWMWEKMAGHSELAFRAANVPWLVLSQWALYRTCRRTGTNPLPLLGIASVNPFVWYYLNEARPYVMQYAGSCMVISGCSGILFRERATDADWWWLTFGLLLLAGSSMLGSVWAASASAGVFFIHLRRGAPVRSGPAATAALGLGGLAAYYVWTLANGARGTSVGGTGLLNLLFATFELFGFAGLGPGRLQIRQSGLNAFADLHSAILPLVGAAVLFLGLLAYTARIAPRTQYRRIAIGAAFYSGPPMLLLLILGYTQHFRILGRHFAPLLPVIIALFTFAIAKVWFRHARLGTLLYAAVITLWLSSALSLRFGERHRKDDYRGAASLAREAVHQGETTWWAADAAAAIYYGLPKGASNAVFTTLMNPRAEDLRRLRPPRIVVLSKHDVYDSSASISAYLAQHDYRIIRLLPAFSIWERP